MTKTSKIIIWFLTIIVFIAAIFFSTKYFAPHLFSDNLNTTEIVLADPLLTLNPFSLVESDLHYLNLIYEPLIALDYDLSYKPVLANSYGQLSDLIWELKIPNNILFHDQTPLTTDLIVANFNHYKSVPQLSPFIQSIQEVKATDQQTLEFHTHYLDPMLLLKLTTLPILPHFDLEKLELQPIGTGPYKFLKHDSFKQVFFKANPSYHLAVPSFQQLVLTAIENPAERNRYAANSNQVVLVYPVAQSDLQEIGTNKFYLTDFSTTTVNFLAFQRERQLFQTQETRSFFLQIFNDEFLQQLIGELGTPTHQFVSQGVNGYNPKIQIPKLSTSEILPAVIEQELFEQTISILLPDTLSNFKTILENYFTPLGLDFQVTLLPQENLLDQTTVSSYDLVFFGWKSVFGDATDFFQSLLVENAPYSLFGFHNPELDQLIAQSLNTSDIGQRQDLLQAAMNKIVLEDSFAIPLFQTDIIYAVKNGYRYQPRLDGTFSILTLFTN